MFASHLVGVSHVHSTVFSIACAIFSITRAIVKTTMDDSHESHESQDKKNKPPSKKPRLSLSLKGKGKARFAAPLPQEEMASVCEGYTPPNTSKNTDWSVRVLDEWSKARPIAGDEEHCPENFIGMPIC